MKKKLFLLIPLISFVVLVGFFIKDIIQIWPELFNGEELVAETLLEGMGWKGVIYLILIQACQMLLVFLPSEIIQVVSGATYGIWYGTLVCWGGLILGATMIYMLVNVFKIKVDTFKAQGENEELIKSLSIQKKSAFIVTLILFFLPAIPYGIICYFASGTKMKYPKYILCCVLGVLPSVLIDSLVGKAAISLINKYLWPIIIGFVLLMVFFLWLVKYITKRTTNKMLYGTPKPLMETVLSKKAMQNPKGFLTGVFYKVLPTIFRVKNKVVCDNKIKNFKSPYILLCAHLSKPDFVYASMALNKEEKPNIVANRYYFNKPMAYGIFDKAGVISKKLFTSDVACVKQIMKVQKNGNGVLMMPEGRLSIDGTNQTLPYGLGKLLKKLEVPVLGVIPHGAYFTGAKWMKRRHKGQVQIESKVILTAEELKQMEADEIERVCTEALSYDDFEWIKDKNIKFRSSNMLKGVEGILYHCPHCDSEFTLHGHKNKIICKNCHNEVLMNNKFEFINPPKENIKNIRDWYKYQIELEKQNILSPDFKMQCKVIAKSYEEYGKGLEKLGEGVCTLDKNGLSFECAENQEYNASINYLAMQSLLFGCGEDFETYINDRFYFFIPKDNKNVCVKWAICAEQMHRIKKQEENNA